MLADLDGTLVGDHQQDVAGSVTAWVDDLRAAGIGVCIVSNSGPARVAPVAAVLDVPYVAHAAKPLRRGIDAGLRTLARPANDVALVGDQLFTDVWGGRRSRLLTILDEPLQRALEARQQRLIGRARLDEDRQQPRAAAAPHVREQLIAHQRDVVGGPRSADQALLTRLKRPLEWLVDGNRAAG